MGFRVEVAKFGDATGLWLGTPLSAVDIVVSWRAFRRDNAG